MEIKEDPSPGRPWEAAKLGPICEISVSITPLTARVLDPGRTKAECWDVPAAWYKGTP